MEAFKERATIIMLPDWLYKAERKLDDCNHLMEMLRTLLGCCTLALQVVILLKLFNVI